MTLSYRSITLLFIIILIFTNCKKQKDYPSDSNEGKDIFGCYVDGKLFIPCNSFQWSIKSIAQGNLSYFPVAYVAAQNRCDKNLDYGREFTFYIDSLNPEENKTYKLYSSFHRANGRISLQYSDETTYYSSDSILEGTITIRRFSPGAKILSANFEATVMTSDGSQVKKLSKGTFDITFW